jgi:hypothetical protein
LGASNHNTQEELEETGYRMGSWVRHKGPQVLCRSGADVCSNTSKQHVWMGFRRCWSYELWGHSKSHKAAGRERNFCPKLEWLNTCHTSRPIVGATSSAPPSFLRSQLQGPKPVAVLAITSVASPTRVPPFLSPSHHDDPNHLQTKVGAKVEDVSPSTTTTTTRNIWPA